MGDLIQLDEIRIRRDLKKAYGALETARTLAAEGIEIDRDIPARIQQIINDLEKKLDKLIESDIIEE